MSKKLAKLLQDFESIVENFAKALAEEKTDIVRDSAIKRFEIAFDLGWKTLKAYLEDYHNVRCPGPQKMLARGVQSRDSRL